MLKLNNWSAVENGSATSLIAVALLAAVAVTCSAETPFRNWAVSTENVSNNASAVVFTLIGVADDVKMPLLVLSFRAGSWNAMLTCGRQLVGRRARLPLSWDGRKEILNWDMTSGNGAAFAAQPVPFVLHLCACHNLEVDFPIAERNSHAIFDVTGLGKEIKRFPRAKKALRNSSRPSQLFALLFPVTAARGR